VALYQPGLSDTEYLRLQLTGAVAASGTAPFEIPAGVGPGTYELRLLSADGVSLLATSGPITVTTVTTAPFAYIHPDHLDTPRLIENQAQQIVWRWDNDDPFGGNAPDEDPSGLGTFTCNLRLPGQYFDQETNNHYNSFRDYSPETGRYIQSDPIGLAGGLNTYLYVHNEPVRLFDEMGLEVRVCYFPQAANGLGHVGIGIVGSPSTYGFYPNAEAGISQLIKGTPGLVAEDPRNPNALTGATCRVLSSTANQDSCIEKCIKSRASNPGTYKLLTRQCTSFARDCLTECMLPAGDPNTPRPGKWYDSLPNGPQSSYIPTPATPIENAPLF
jgi:RHS repeat-associated protein